MPTIEELQGDNGFMSATPNEQAQFLSETDPSFKAAHPDDQAAFLAHVTKKPTGAEAYQPKPGLLGKLDTAKDAYSQALEPVDQAVTKALAPKPTADILPTEYREVPKALGRNIYGTAKTALGTIAGLPSAIGHAFGDEATPEEKAKYAPFEQAHGEAPGTETSGMKRVGLGFGRILGGDETEQAAQTWMNPETRPTAGQVLDVAEPALQQGAGTVLGMEAAGKLGKIPSKETMPATTGAVEAGVRKLGQAYQAVREKAPEVGAVAGGTIGAATHGPAGAAYGTYTGGRVGKILQKITPEGTAAAEFGMQPDERNVYRLEKAVKEADKAAAKAADDHSVYQASEEHGPIDPDVNPAYKKSLENLKKAQAAQAEAHFHLQEAKRAATEATADRAAITGEAREITPQEAALARPEAPTPTKEESDAKLRGMMEKIAPTEAPKPTPENVKTPGQVQPETFPMEPLAAPRAESPMGDIALPEGKGVLKGKQRLLGVGAPEAEPAAEEPKPFGEILPPEKPATPAEMRGLGAKEGKVVEAPEKAIGPLIQEGLKRGAEEAKPVALKPLGAPEERIPSLGKITPELVETPKTAEAPKAEEAKVEMAPEDLTKVEKTLSDHSDQDLLRTAAKEGIDTDKYDLALRDEKRHRIDRDRLVKDTLDRMSDKDKANIARLAGEFDNKDATTWIEAERNNLSRAQRARAIMQEHRGGITAGEGGGVPDEHRGAVEEGGGVYRGVQEGVPSANLKGLVLFDHPETKSTLALPEDQVTPEAVAEKLKNHKEMWDKYKMEPVPSSAEDLKAAVAQPFHILGQEEKVAPEQKAVTEPKVNPAPAEPRPALDRSKIQGGDIAQPHTNYHEASQAEGNPWVRRSSDPANDAQPTNEKRTLLVQFASELLQKDAMNDDAKAYYDKLYSGAREGYARMRDFWETPQWMGFASHILPDSDVYVVRDMDSAKEFLNKAGYGHVAFSALDVNTPFIKELAKEYPGKFDVGGYVKPEDLLKDSPNVRWHENMESFAKEHGVEYKNGVDYRHFEGSDVIPRLTLSDGCLHKCAFCIVPKEIKMTPTDVINQQADAIADMKSKLVYLNDKTFGQAKNHTILPDLFDRMKERNPDFQGFVVQTTAAQLNKMTPEFLKKSGIKFAEIGVETYNDALLKEMHKPATESLIDKSMAKLKDAGIAAIPNIIIGMPGENAATYAHTLEFLRKNADNISHANIYNLALYKDSELGQKLAVGADSDLDENVLHKSFHTDPQVHATFAGDMYDLGQKLLSKKIGEPEGAVHPGEAESDVEMARRGAQESPDETIARLHNESDIPKGSSFHPVEGNLQGKEGYAVGSKISLEQKVEGTKLTSKDISAYRENPDVAQALKDDPKAFIGTWEHEGNVYMDVSKFEPDLEKAKSAGKENGQKAIYDLKGKKEIILEGTKQYKDMTPEEQETLAAKGVSGGSQATTGKEKAVPTGDALIKKYGESDGDPSHTAFILSDGRGVAQAGVEHSVMTGGLKSLPKFVNSEGAIRMRAMGAYGDRQFNLSLPEDGISAAQLKELQRMAPQMATGKMYIEAVNPEGVFGKRVKGGYQVLDYGKVSPESIEDAIKNLGLPIKSELPEIAEKHLLPEEKLGVSKSKQQLDKFVTRMTEMPELHEWTDAASKGAGERKWYQRSTQAFDAMSKEAPLYFDQEGDRDKFIGLLASSSPQQAVVENMKEALRVWTKYVDNGRPTGTKLEDMLSKSKLEGGFTIPGAKIPNAMKALAGEPMWPDITKNKNFKVPSFRDNLTGMLNRVTTDGWMALFAGLDARDVSSAHSYHPISIMTRAAAEELGWEPAEAQAAIWAFIKTLTEKGVEASEDPEEMRQYSEDFADILKHDPETRELLKDMGVSHAKLDKRLATIEAKPAPVTSGVSPTAEDSARRARERVEAARGKGAIPPPKTGFLKFGEPEAEGRGTAGGDEAVSFEPSKFETRETPKQVAKGGSGESAASLEAINRAKGEKAKGISYVRIDSRSGRETPIIGADALDSKAGPYEHIVKRGPEGEVTLDSGKNARPLGFIKGKKS